jgi:long-subunit acyl-CoA synthetase (AMP-forming)
VIASGESGKVAYYSFRQLREMVRQMAAAMRANGLKVGDRVAGECILDFSCLQMHEMLINDTSNCDE